MPLAAVDLKRKLEILPYLERLHRELAIPIIYVSHGLMGSHWHSTDVLGFVAVGCLSAVAIWLSGRNK